MTTPADLLRNCKCYLPPLDDHQDEDGHDGTLPDVDRKISHILQTIRGMFTLSERLSDQLRELVNSCDTARIALTNQTGSTMTFRLLPGSGPDLERRYRALVGQLAPEQIDAIARALMKHAHWDGAGGTARAESPKVERAKDGSY